MSVVESSDPRADVMAERVIRSLDGVPADELYALAEGFRFAGGPVLWFFNPIYSLGVDREHELERDRDEPVSWLVRLQMGVALTSAARSDLVERLHDTDLPFWIAVRDALTELAERE